MKKLILISLAFSSLVHADTSAVQALKRYIPTFDHHGVNGLGQTCSIDMYSRSGGIMIELVMPKFSKFLVTPEMSYETDVRFLRISAAPYSENEGIVTNSVVFEDRDVYQERRYCKGNRCWNSVSERCRLDPW